jgi:circadian clock protein KaiC
MSAAAGDPVSAGHCIMPIKNTRKPRLSTTGIDGLDTILVGGLPEHRFYLIKGDPGVGKTTLALQYLLAGAAKGEKGMYITLSETKDEILSVADSHGWDLAPIAIFELSALEHQLAQEAQNTVFQPSEVDLNNTTDLLLNRIKAEKPERLVIDSLSELRLLSDTALRYRRQMLALKQFFAGREMTVLMLDDHSGVGGGDVHVQSIAHGVLTIEQRETDYGADRRRVKINKLRGVNFVGGFHDAIIAPGGLKVFPRLVAADHQGDFPAETMSSGLPQLDELLGSGLDRGTSCLLLGPAGTGKSTIAQQFAIAAAKRKEKVTIFLFEENLRTLLARSASMGMPIAKLRKAGLIEFIQIDPAQLAPGQFVALVRSKVEQDHTRVIIIDSLNGYLQAMPNARHLEIQLHEMLSFLSHRGVVTILTVAQHGLMGNMQSPVDLTYLADTVLLLRYFEESGRIRKAISIIKKRIGYHEDTIREFKLDANGLRVGEPLQNFQGVLTGVPTYKGSSKQMLGER